MNFWLVVASWMVTFAALAWGRRRRGGSGTEHPPLMLPHLPEGLGETVEIDRTASGEPRITRRGHGTTETPS